MTLPAAWLDCSDGPDRSPKIGSNGRSGGWGREDFDLSNSVCVVMLITQST
jgi:hypothetical protein